MARQQGLKEYFSFTKKDRIAAFVMAGLMLIIYLLPGFLPGREGKPVIADSLFVGAADSTMQPSSTERDENSFATDHSIPSASLFEFDPNNLSAAAWASLGLRPKTILTIQNYLSKGGRFRQPADLEKIWGLPPGFYERVKDHIRIAPEVESYRKPFIKNQETKVKTYEPTVIMVNTADSVSFTALKGIGEKLAARITAFREKLGGFYSVEQVGETYGLPDSTFQRIKPLLKLDGEVKKINVNTATKDQLKVHPYIRWKLANAIVEYRNQHGNFNSVEELKKIVLITEDVFKKLQPYLTCEQQ